MCIKLTKCVLVTNENMGLCLYMQTILILNFSKSELKIIWISNVFEPPLYWAPWRSTRIEKQHILNMFFPRGGTMSAQSSGSSIAAGSKRPAPSPQPTSPAQPASLAASPADAEKPKRKSISLQVILYDFIIILRIPSNICSHL